MKEIFKQLWHFLICVDSKKLKWKVVCLLHWLVRYLPKMLLRHNYSVIKVNSSSVLLLPKSLQFTSRLLIIIQALLYMLACIALDYNFSLMKYGLRLANFWDKSWSQRDEPNAHRQSTAGKDGWLLQSLIFSVLPRSKNAQNSRFINMWSEFGSTMLC